MALLSDLPGYRDFMVEMIGQLDGSTFQTPHLAVVSSNRVLFLLFWILVQTAGHRHRLPGDFRVTVGAALRTIRRLCLR